MRLRKPYVLLAVVLVAIVIISSTIFLGLRNTEIGGSQTNNQMTNGTTLQVSSGNESATANSSAGATSSSVSKEELAKHNSFGNCWISYKGRVYDITSFLPKHPGSAGAILPYCGTANEFEQAFTAMHGTSKAGNLMKVGIYIGDFVGVGSLA